MSSIDVNRFIAEQKFGRPHAGIVALCALAMFTDGFDTQIVGYIAQNLTRSLHLQPGALGSVLSAGGAGILLGSLFVAPVADYVGRKNVIVGCLWFFAIASFATALASTVPQLAWLRFIAGLALGGLTPNALALTSEYMPTRYKVARVTLVWCGYSLGSSLGGPAANYILAHYDWHAMFVVCGVLPVIAALVVIPLLPESVLYLVRHNAPRAQVRKLLQRLSPEALIGEDTQFVLPEKKESRVPVVPLFTDGRAPMTILLWVVYFMNLSMIYFMNGWLPTVLNNSGLSEAVANNVSSVAHLAGLAGGLVIAMFSDRWKKFGALALASACAAIFTVAMGAAGGAPLLVAAMTLAAGFFVYGVMNTVNGLAPSLYPTALRSTGAGWATGIGRISAITSPIIGGILLGLQWSPSNILYLVALPAVVSLFASLGLGRATKSR